MSKKRPAVSNMVILYHFISKLGFTVALDYNELPLAMLCFSGV